MRIKTYLTWRAATGETAFEKNASSGMIKIFRNKNYYDHGFNG